LDGTSACSPRTGGAATATDDVCTPTSTAGVGDMTLSGVQAARSSAATAAGSSARRRLDADALAREA
jgi:hypothetical protein